MRLSMLLTLATLSRSFVVCAKCGQSRSKEHKGLTLHEKSQNQSPKRVNYITIVGIPKISQHYI